MDVGTAGCWRHPAIHLPGRLVKNRQNGLDVVFLSRALSKQIKAARVHQPYHTAMSNHETAGPRVEATEVSLLRGVCTSVWPSCQ